jgi:hypothetical protein
MDGGLIALDAKSGKVDSQVQTTPDEWYTSIGALRMIKGKVMIGNGGAEYAAAAASGKGRSVVTGADS